MHEKMRVLIVHDNDKAYVYQTTGNSNLTTRFVGRYCLSEYGVDDTMDNPYLVWRDMLAEAGIVAVKTNIRVARCVIGVLE